MESTHKVAGSLTRARAAIRAQEHLAWSATGSWPAGAGYGDREGEDLSGAGPVGQPVEVGDVVIGRPPFGGHDEQSPPVRTAEHQRERARVSGSSTRCRTS